MMTHSALFRQQCYLNGQWVNALQNKTKDVFNPFDQTLLGTIPDCGQSETITAIEAASHAFNDWREKTGFERGKILWRWAELIDQHKEDLARIMTLEQGKPIKESRGEIDYANSFIKWFAEEARRVYGDIIPADKKGQRLLVIKQPIGVVGAITPWNFPAAMITRKVAPALATGCTVIIKPAEETPFTALALCVLAEEAGFPAGVINMITGNAKEIGLELTTNPLVRKISFTGSTKVGKLLMEQSASTLKKISLELGGNAPFIIFDDADLDAAIQGVMASKFRNTGQTCVSANRILVQETIYDLFTEKLIAAVKTLKLGNGLDESVQQGPLINEKALEKVEKHVRDATEKGAKVVLGGKKSPIGKLFFEPTVLTNVHTDTLVAKEETFGPIAPLFRFKTDKDAIEMANHTPFGLASYFYSRDVSRIWKNAEALEYGMVGVNVGILSTAVAPFGGVKESGIGREGSKYGIDEYLEIKYICLGVS